MPVPASSGNPPNPNNVISKIGDNSSYALVKLSLAEKDYDRLYKPLTNYKHLRHLDLSTNQITDF